MLKVARESGRKVQVGLHRRIDPHHVSGMDFLKSGRVGRIGMVRMFVNSSGSGPEEPSARALGSSGPDPLLLTNMRTIPMRPTRPDLRKSIPETWCGSMRR